MAGNVLPMTGSCQNPGAHGLIIINRIGVVWYVAEMRNCCFAFLFYPLSYPPAFVVGYAFLNFSHVRPFIKITLINWNKHHYYSGNKIKKLLLIKTAALRFLFPFMFLSQQKCCIRQLKQPALLLQPIRGRKQHPPNQRLKENSSAPYRLYRGWLFS